MSEQHPYCLALCLHVHASIVFWEVPYAAMGCGISMIALRLRLLLST